MRNSVLISGPEMRPLCWRHVEVPLFNWVRGRGCNIRMNLQLVTYMPAFADMNKERNKKERYREYIQNPWNQAMP